MKILRQSIILFLSLAFVFIWQQTILSSYTIQIMGFFIFLYLLISFVRRKNAKEAYLSNALSVVTLIIVVLLIVFSTGEFSSGLFFLLYFLLFAIAFVFEPLTVFVLTIGLILIFLPDSLRDDTVGNFIKLGSLIFISPLAFFFGKEYRKSQEK